MSSSLLFTRIFSIARKEVRHILRDPFTMASALGLPVIMVLFFGFAIDFTPKDVQLMVFDGDQTRSSRELIDVFSGSGYFKIEYGQSPRDLLWRLDSEKAKAAVIINPGFQKDLRGNLPTDIQVILDGSDNSSTGVILGYLGGLQRASTERLVGLLKQPVRLETRFLFNPELNSRWFIVPGLTVVVISIVSILLTALTVAREWENGSMELLLSTPVQPLELILGKLIPYLFLGLGGVAFVYLMARLVLGVPFVGSHLIFFIGSLIFLAAYLAQGLLISVVTRKQQLSMQFAMMSGLLPSLLLSGFIFPIESMPVFFRYFTAILPARWFIVICRGVFLKDASLFDLGLPFAALLMITIGIIALASAKFKKDLEP